MHQAPDSADETRVYLGCDGKLLARFEIADALRPDAAQVVRSFREQGKDVILLSGDAPDVAAAVGAQLGIATSVGGQLLRLTSSRM
ncbi:HAD family hydrolase [Massilia sp. B-10]|nr:HAD family hydrolase [Massilia sp. B-10]